MGISREDYYKWVDTFKDGYCAFCEWEKEQEILEIGNKCVWINSKSPVWRYHTMIIPKRHIEDITEMTADEIVEMFSLYKHVLDVYRGLKLEKNGVKLNKYEMLWRARDDKFDPVTGNAKPCHFHLNIYPFLDHHTDPVMEQDAYKYDIRNLIGNNERTTTR